MSTRGLREGQRWLLVPLGAASLLLVASEFLTLYEIRAVTAVPEGGTNTGGGHHGYALLVIGLALGVMSWGAVVGGSRPAALGVVVLALAATFVVFGIDLPDVTDEGVIGQRYDEAKASPQIGFYLESAAAVLALIGAAGLHLLRPARAA